MRLKRVFDSDIKTCSHCGGDVKITASIAFRRVLTYCEVQYTLIDGNTPFMRPILQNDEKRH